MVKKDRHDAILNIINTHLVSTQLELAQYLKKEGYETTQATLSRDIRQMGLVKKSDSAGRSFYSTSQRAEISISGKYISVFKQSVVSVDIAGHLLVIKCFAGMAPAACAALDSMKWDGIVGTIAGDDTIFVACRTEEFAAEMEYKIGQLID